MKEKSFSERQGIVKPRLDLQLDGIDDELKNALWNLTLNDFFKTFKTTNGDNFSVYGETEFSKMAKAIWEHFLNRPSDSLRSKNYTSFPNQIRINLESKLEVGSMKQLGIKFMTS